VRALPLEPIEVAYLALSGVVPPGPESEAAGQVAARVWAGAAIHINHDVRAAWAGAFGLRPGIIIVAGSGSAAFGVAPDGREARAGGWGYLFGDQGAAWWIAREGIMAALRAGDGIGPETALTARLTAYFKTENIAAVVRAFYAGRLTRTVVAAASRIVLATAAEGDPVCRGLVARGAHALATMVDAVRRRLQWDGEVPVAPTGGMWHSKLLREMFTAGLSEIDHRMVVRTPVVPPPVGAFVLALQASGAPVPLETIRASWEAVAHAPL